MSQQVGDKGQALVGLQGERPGPEAWCGQAGKGGRTVLSLVLNLELRVPGGLRTSSRGPVVA